MSQENQYSRSFFGHPRGLATLFFTELWERFTYYGMRALLILFMTADVEHGGLQFDVVKAGAIYGLFTSMVYMTSLPGGWIADKFLGQRKAVLVGGIIIAAGSFILIIHSVIAFYLGLTVIVIGTGLLKPNASSIVGQLYDEKDNRRDAGFSIFYMGINLGAMIAPLICGYLGQRIDWHFGFGAAGVGMTFGIIQYVLGWKYLGDAGLHPAKAATPEIHQKHKRTFWLGTFITIGVICAGYLLESSGIVDLSLQTIIRIIGVGIIVLPVIFFTMFFMEKGWEPVERRRIAVIAILFLFTALFWGAFEQAGSTLNLFADRFTDTSVLGFKFPSSWFQSVNATLIIIFAPVFAWIWIKLGKKEPSSPAKFSLGLFFVSFGYLLLVPAALIVVNQSIKVAPFWLVGVYMFHTFGELSLSPVGLSMVTKLAPPRILGQMMGIWFMTISIGNFVGGQVAGLFESLPLPQLFGTVFATTAGAGLLLAIFIKPIRKLMGGVN
ncbi:MAG: peptide MFS transporter [Bacteroidota bacterium]